MKENLFKKTENISANEDIKRPSWSLITALDRVLDEARDSALSDEFWNACQDPIDYLKEQLGFTKMQIVFLAILIETGEAMSWRKFGTFLNCSRISMMCYTEELEDLVAKRWVVHKAAREFSGLFTGFALVHGVVTALRNNRIFVPEKLDGFTEQEFIDKIVKHTDKFMEDPEAEFIFEEEWMVAFCEANSTLPLCRTALSLDTLNDKALLLMIVRDYALYADTINEGYTIASINNTFQDDYDREIMKNQLLKGTHALQRKGYIENKCYDGIADPEEFVLTKKAKDELLSQYKPAKMKVATPRNDDRFLKSHSSIQEKELFFNQAEQEQIDRLTTLLSQDNLPSIQRRLEEQGMRKGFACLFYGAPGTGKTETVLQIARKTGRNIMQIDIAGLRDKWVGESEKNIKNVFDRYRELCQDSEIMPILFFNEADGIISKRTEDVSHSVDKMDNAMQNIILQEIENIEGILIATTNLTCNLDSAFERRFIYKIKFNKPDIDVKAKIWRSMLNYISESYAKTLASKFDFSGGQIENIARKRTVDYILNGKISDLDEIEKYCLSETLDDSKKCRTVGFRA